MSRMNLPLMMSAYASLFALGLGDNARGPLFPEILETFGVSNALGAWMFAGSSLAGAVGARMSRFWLARFTRVKTLNLTLLGMGFGMTAMSVAPTFAIFIIAAAANGYCWGLMGVLQNAIVSTASSDGHRSRALGGLHAMYGLSSLLAPLIVIAVARAGGSWRATLGLLGVSGFAIFAFNHIRFRGAEHGALAHPHRRPATASPPLGVSLWLAGGIAMYVVCEILVSSRLAQFQRLEHGATLEESSAITAAFFLALLTGRLLTAAFPLREGTRTALLACLAATAAALALGLAGRTWWLAASGLTMGPIYPLAVALFGREFGEGIDGLMSWVLTIQGCLVASMHGAVGWVTDAAGIRAAMTIGPAALVVSFAMLGLYGTVFRRHAARI